MPATAKELAAEAEGCVLPPFTLRSGDTQETIVLESAAAPNSHTYAIAHEGFTLRESDAGQWGLYKPDAECPLMLL